MKTEGTGGSSEEDIDVDTSDEIYLKKHDQVLRNMREKWALMQQLKIEARRDGNQISVSNSSSSGVGLTGNRKSFSSFHQSPYKLSKMSSFSSDLPPSEHGGNNSRNELSERLPDDNYEHISPKGSNGTTTVKNLLSTSLSGLFSSFPNKKRSYSLLNIDELGEVAGHLIHSSSSSNHNSINSNNLHESSIPSNNNNSSVKKRGRPPKIQKTSHLHYGKISN
jgi:hypothetical protein